MSSKKEYQTPKLYKNKFSLKSYLDHTEDSPPTERLIKYVVVRALLLSESGEKLILARRPKSSAQAPNLWSYIGGKVDLNYPSSTDFDLIQTSEVPELGFSENDWQKVQGESFNDALLRELDEELRVIDAAHPLLHYLSLPKGVDAYHANKTLTVIMKVTIPDGLINQLHLASKPATEQMTDLQAFALENAPIENMAFEYAHDFLQYLHQSAPDIVPAVIKNAVVRIGGFVESLPISLLTELASDEKNQKRRKKLINLVQKHARLVLLIKQLWESNNLQPGFLSCSLQNAATQITEIKKLYADFLSSEDTVLTQFDDIHARLSRLAKATERLTSLTT